MDTRIAIRHPGVIPIVYAVVLALCSTISGEGIYPWIHYFERPEHPYIHRAFSDGVGDLIVSTGDWLDWDWAGVYIDVYWSTGIFRIDGADIYEIACPENTFVLDAAVDTEGRTWVTYGTGIDHYNYNSTSSFEETLTDDLEAPIDLIWAGQHRGYRPWYYVSDVSNRRIGRLMTDSLLGYPDFTSAIPGEPIRLNSDASGRKFVVSRLCLDPWEDRYKHFLSWWDGEDIDSLIVLGLPEGDLASERALVLGFPSFGPDGRIYLHIRDNSVISIDPRDQEWLVFDLSDSPLPQSNLEYFYIDRLGILWFATKDGLLCFDGSNWAVCTTDNTDLPYNEVKQLAYDEIDNLYYVITQKKLGSMGYVAALSILTPTGRQVIAPMYFPETSYRFNHPIICRDDNGVLWLCSFNTSILYSYDHKQVICWDSQDYFAPPNLAGFVDSMTSGWNFCIAGDYYRGRLAMVW